jgi:hypothetical protein
MGNRKKSRKMARINGGGMRNAARRVHPLYRFIGITRAARELGVSYPHLWMVLTGRRVSRRLVQRWEAWQAKGNRRTS